MQDTPLAVYNYRNLSTMNEYGSKILSKGKKKKRKEERNVAWSMQFLGSAF